MQTKLTLRIDDSLIEEAKALASKRGKSLSQMIADYILGFRKRPASEGPPLTPLVASMKGILKGRKVHARRDWRRHLDHKYR
jgi:hypothetical protein